MAKADESADSTRERPPRKDRLVQTRVPRDLEEKLKQEAQRRRLTVSHLVRNVLEDAFQLMDGVVDGVDQLVSDSMTLARTVARGARPDRRREDAPAAEEVEADPDLSHVHAWSEVVLNQSAHCARCGASIARGERGFAGLGEGHRKAPVWLCSDCIGEL